MIYTIGHSTRTLEDFLALLHSHNISLLIDVRSVPRSWHNPQYNLDALPAALELAGISHLHLPSLGGLRRPEKQSINTAWKNNSFRGFADYMQKPGFAAGIEELIEYSSQHTAAIMCAEAVPWKCHRSMISDALCARKIPVRHIMGLGIAKPHKMTAFAKTSGSSIIYPLPSLPLFEGF
jgi:uncharacterized protein (DUF488 family)